MSSNGDLMIEPERGEDDEERPALDVPPRDRKLLTQPFDFIVGSLKRQIEDKDLILRDDFQRRQVWDNKKASALIESLLLNVPIPVCYFAELDDGVYSVIDGQQRLTSVYRFLDNQFALTKLSVRSELNGKSFYEMDKSDQRLINTRAIRCISILKESNPDIRFDIFQRLNSAAVALNPQELRNSIYRGSLNSLVRELCKHERFQKIRRVDELDPRMGDAEMILRFFAFHYAASGYRSLYSRFLDEYLKAGQNADTHKIADHRLLFIDTVDKVDAVFGTDAFRKMNADGVTNQVNRAIFDIIMLTFARIAKERLIEHRNDIISGLRSLCIEDNAFQEAIGGATRDKNRVNARLEIWQKKLTEIGLDCPLIKVGSQQ